MSYRSLALAVVFFLFAQVAGLAATEEIESTLEIGTHAGIASVAPEPAEGRNRYGWGSEGNLYALELYSTGFVVRDHEAGGKLIKETVDFAIGSRHETGSGILIVDEAGKLHVVIASPRRVGADFGQVNIDRIITLYHFTRVSAGQWTRKSYDTPANAVHFPFRARLGSSGALHVLVRASSLLDHPDLAEGIYKLIRHDLHYGRASDSGAIEWQLLVANEARWNEPVANWLGNYRPEEGRDLPAVRALDLAVDSDNHAHVIYCPAYEVLPAPGKNSFTTYRSALRYATNANGAWTHQDVARPAPSAYGDFGVGASLDLGPKGQPRVAWHRLPRAPTGSPQSSSLMFSERKADGTWRTETVAKAAAGFVSTDGNMGTGVLPTLRHDEAGVPYILFSDIATSHRLGEAENFVGNLRLANRPLGQSAWNKRTLLAQTRPFAEGVGVTDFAVSRHGLAVVAEVAAKDEEGEISYSETRFLHPARAAQTLTFNPPAQVFVKAQRIQLAASAAPSRLPVTFSVVSGPARIDEDGFTLVLSGTGEVLLRASQRGSALFLPASEQERSVLIVPGPPTLSQTVDFAQPTAVTYGDGPLLLSAQASSGLPVAFRVLTGPGLLAGDGRSLGFIGPGQVRIEASQPGNGDFKPAPVAVRTLEVRPAAPSLPAALARTVAGSVDLNVRGINPASGVAYVASGLPDGLRLDAKTGQLTGRITAGPGAYAVTLWAVSGKTKGETRTLTLTVEPYPAGLIGSFEGLLTDSGSGLPAGKVALTVATNGRFTGTLVTPLPKTYPLKGNLTVNDDGTAATLTLPVAPYSLVVTLASAGATPLAATLTQAGVVRGNLSDGVRLAAYTGKATSTAAWAAPAYTFALGEPRSNLDLTTPPRPLPGGAGYAVGSVNAKGLLTLSGKLADGRPFTASLAATTDAAYRLYAQPYGLTAPAVADNYLAGGLRLVAASATAPVRYRTIPAEDGSIYWHKPRADKDPNYRLGFGPVALTARLGTWIAPNAKAEAPLPTTLADALELPSPPVDLSLAVAGGGLSDAQLIALPDALRLDAKGGFAPLPVPPPKTWVFKLAPTTGKFTGSFVVSDPAVPPATKSASRTISFEGVLLQSPPDEVDAVLGGGYFLVPANTKGGAGEAGALELRRDP